jgi:hypothetical protein
MWKIDLIKNRFEFQQNKKMYPLINMLLNMSIYGVSVFIVSVLIYHCNALKNACRLKNLINQWETQMKSSLFIITETEPRLFVDNCYHFDSDISVARFMERFRTLDPDQTIDLIIHTNGGDTNNCKLMIDTIFNHHGQIRVYIPKTAYSAGTLLSLVGNEIHMDHNAHLTPFDTQITMSQNDIFQTPIPVGILRHIPHLTTKKQKNLSEFSNLLAIQSQMAQQTYEADLKIMETIFSNRSYTSERKTQIIENLLHSKIPHDYLISYHEAISFGLPLSSNEIPEMSWDIISCL